MVEESSRQMALRSWRNVCWKLFVETERVAVERTTTSVIACCCRPWRVGSGSVVLMSVESWCVQRIRGFTTMRYINWLFTYLLRAEGIEISAALCTSIALTFTFCPKNFTIWSSFFSARQVKIIFSISPPKLKNLEHFYQMLQLVVCLSLVLLQMLLFSRTSSSYPWWFLSSSPLSSFL